MPNEASVVLVEDDPNISDLVDMYLRQDGFRVYQATTGERGLEQVRDRDPRLVILDIGLAGEMDGTRYRLIGIGYSGLIDAVGDSGDLLDPQAIRRATAERAMDKARAKFGTDAVVKGRALRSAKDSRQTSRTAGSRTPSQSD